MIAVKSLICSLNKIKVPSSLFRLPVADRGSTNSWLLSFKVRSYTMNLGTIEVGIRHPELMDQMKFTQIC